MEVLSLTVFLSLLLAAVFVIAFVRMASRPNAGCVDREALLPLQPDGGAAHRPDPWGTAEPISDERAENNH